MLTIYFHYEYSATVHLLHTFQFWFLLFLPKLSEFSPLDIQIVLKWLHLSHASHHMTFTGHLLLMLSTTIIRIFHSSA